MTAPGTPRVTRIILQNFRSYADLDLPVSRRLVALAGENGAGKTNLIEALSLFTPGRGLRRADLRDMAKSGVPRFAASIVLADPDGERRLGVGLDIDEAGRPVRLCRVDGAAASSPAAFAEHLRVVWLTPDLDGLFRGPAGDRRRFLDRLVLAIDARHGARVNALDRALRSRNRLLEECGAAAWLDAVERELAELAVAVAAARRETAERLDAELLAGLDDASPFPFVRLSVEGEFDAMVGAMPAVDAEESYRAALRTGRTRDAAAGRTLLGPQATDLAVRHGPKDLPAAICSTGEQKALLLGLVLAHARLVTAMSGIAPLVLLDEVAAHLDPGRRAALFGVLDDLGGQVWMTGADPAFFADLDGRADRLQVADGRVTTLGSA